MVGQVCLLLACAYRLATSHRSYHLVFSIVLVWTVENATKTVVCKWIDECVLGYTENEFF